MVKYYYDKYNAVITDTVYSDDSPWENANNSSVYLQYFYQDYTFNSTTNKYSHAGETYGSAWLPVGTVGYLILDEGDSIQRSTVTSAGTGDNPLSADNAHKYASKNSKTVNYARGSLIQSNIIAENGTYPENGRYTDGYWYVRGAVVNQSPVITPTTPLPSGTIETKPSFAYKVTDPDGNSMTVTESIDGIVFNTRTNVASGTTLTFTPTDIAWLRTRIKQVVNITITANDGNGGVTTVNYPITRTTPAIDLRLKTPFTTDVAAKRLLLKLEGNIPADAVVNVQACNNAFDANPTWENATNLVLRGFPYPFTNTTKTAAKWGILFKVRIERGGSTQPIYLDGLGGAFD